MELKQQRRLANWLHYGKWRIWTQERIKIANYSPQLEFSGSFSVSLRKISEVHGDCFNVMLFISIIHWYLLYCTNWIGAQKHNNIDKKWLQFGACVNSLKRPLRPHPSLVGAVNITSHFVKLGRLCAHALFYKTRHYAPAVSCTHPFICRLFQRAFVSASLLFKGRQGKREELSSLQVNECERVGVCPDWMVHYLTMENWSLSVSKCPAPRVGFSPFPFFTSSSSPIICLTGPHYGGKGIYKYI